MKNVAITGAGSGIGLAIAERFAADGYRVHIADISEERLQEAKTRIGDELRTTTLDVTDYEQVRAFVESAAAGGGLDVFVNNAGIFDGYAGVQETTPELWSKILSVNLTGTYNGCKAASDIMVEQKHGHIVNIGSVAGTRGAADGLAYTASKAGINGMTRRLAVDVAQYGINVNVVAPGVTKTNLRATSEEQLAGVVDMNRGIGASPELWDFLIPAHRTAEPAEVANVVRFLASDEASYVNGQIIHVDGGWTAT